MFTEFIKKQVKIKSIKDALLLLLKLIVIIVIAHEAYYVICRIWCLVSREQNTGELFVYLIKQIVFIFIIYAFYRLFKKSKRKGTVRRTAIIFILICALTYWLNGSLLGIFYFDGPYWGKVVDADTGEPISGANIMGNWEFECVVFIQSIFTYADTRETVTDNNGRFLLPPARKVLFWPFSRIYLKNLCVYKPGYDSHPPQMQYVWSDVQKEEWKNKLTKLNTKYKYGDDTATNYYMTFYKFPKEIKPYMPTIIRLNKAITKEEQNNVKSGFVFGSYHCDIFKIRKFDRALKEGDGNEK